MLPYLQAFRALSRRRAFTVLAITTLALGIGVATTAFSIVNGVLLRPLPYPAADRLVAVYEASPARSQRTSLIAPARLADWERLNRTFAAISGSYGENVTDTSGAEPERLEGRRVMARFFDVYAARPIAGRTFLPEEERFGGSAAAIISEQLWTRRFGRSGSAIGIRLIVAGAAYPIVGVMPRTFASAATDVWLPAQVSPGLMQARDARFLAGVARMKPGVTLTQAREDLIRVQRQLAAAFPASDTDWSVDVRGLKDVRVGGVRQPVLLVSAAVAVLFAIAVANVAGLVLVQLHRRSAEFAIRTAIGASRWQVVSGVMREMSILAAAGAALGSLAAVALTRAATGALTTLPRIGEVGVDGRALAFAIAASLIATAIFGAIAAFAAAHARPAALASAGRGVAGGRHRLQTVIVTAQLALGVMLAGSAGLLIRSYAAMATVDSGWSADRVTTFHVGAAWDEDRVRVGQFQVALLDALRGMPGVQAAGFSSFLPATGATLRSQVRVDGLSSDERGGAFTVGQRTVSAGYPQALSVPLLAGAWCEAPRADIGVNRVREVLVNRAFVERFAAGQPVVGRGLSFVQQGVAAFRIAGVIGDVREDGPAAAPSPYVYACLAAGSWPDPEYVVKSSGDPRALAAAIRAAVSRLDASRPVFALQPLTAIADAALDQPRLNAAALGGFAAAALGLAALGLYGLLMLLVAQQRRELGVRMALGATPRELASVVAAGAGKLVAGGLTAGVALSLIAGRLLQTLLFGVGPYDAAALASGVAALAVVALIAIVIPARQAARASAIDAMKAGG